MTIKLYYILPSPPARSVIFALKTLNIPYKLQEIDFLKGEHRTEEFVKMNPQHTVPTLDDDGFIVCDSHAINAYLVNKYAKNDKLYPKEPKARSVVDHRLHFDTGVLFQCVKNVTKAAVFLKTITSISDDIRQTFEDAYQMCEKYLAETTFFAGPELTIADFSAVTTISNMNVIVPVSKEKYPLIVAYIQRCKLLLPDYAEINEKGIEVFRGFYESTGFNLLPGNKL